jgi:hypothetical protein
VHKEGSSDSWQSDYSGVAGDRPRLSRGIGNLGLAADGSEYCIAEGGRMRSLSDKEIERILARTDAVGRDIRTLLYEFQREQPEIYRAIC